MSTILVEARKLPICNDPLDLIAGVCRAAGHDVFRWRSPCSGRVPYWRTLFNCDVAVLYNATHARYAQSLARFQAMQARLVFVELGWHPQKGTVQVDSQGINARASWAAEPLRSVGRTPLAVKSSGDLLVAMQLDDDTQITQLSPHFKNMRGFVEHLCHHSALPVRVRRHPLAPPDPGLEQMVVASGGSIDQSRNLAEAMAGCKALACVNSSCGVEALDYRLPVLCYGEAVYRHAGAVYCLDASSTATRTATAELAAGRCSLYLERMQETVSRVLSRQWTLEEIPFRFPPLLASVLAARRPEPMPSWVARAMRPWRDLPEWLFPRPQIA